MEPNSTTQPSRPAGSFWGRLSLVNRILATCALTTLLSVPAMLYGIVQHDVESGRNDLAQGLRHEVESSATAIAEPVLIGDYSLIEQLLRARVAQSKIAHIRYTDQAGIAINAQSLELERQAPKWFARWARAEYTEESRSIEIGGRKYGTLTVTLDPAPMIDVAWQHAFGMARRLLLVILAFFLVTLAIVNAGLRPISELATAARRFSRGEHWVRVAPDGPPEVATSLCAFNALAETVESLVRSLDESRATAFAEKELAQVTLASIADGVISTDADRRIVYLNSVAARLTGWTLEEARGRQLEEVFRVEAEAGAGGQTQALPGTADGGTVTGGGLLVAREGRRTPIVESAAPIRNRDDLTVGVVVVFRDVSEPRKLAEQLSWQATHDALTGLVNRREFERRLTLLVQQARVDNSSHALLYIDLDQFKVVNDTCGHVAGDELLRQAAGTLHRGVRDADTFARLGGDEFGVLLPGCSLERAIAVAEQLRESVQQLRFPWKGSTFSIASSIGVVGISQGDETTEGVLAAADTACYSAKEKGRNRVQAYRPDDDELARRRNEMQWITRIRHALENDRLHLDCQRIEAISPASGCDDHYEVLMRMLDDNGAPIPPMAFIPAAERYDLMPAIDRYVLEHALSALGAARRASRAGGFPVLTINLSGASLGDDSLCDHIRGLLDAYAIPPSAVCFEITETAAIGNLTSAARLMRELGALGCRFSLDDFGSGLSSFAYLKNLPVHLLKIDGCFVKDLVTDPIDSAMVRAINDIGHVMGIRTVAEWVEDRETLSALRAMGVDYAQGFGIERPRPLKQMLDERVALAPRRAAA